MNSFQDNEEAAITTPTNISVVVPLNTMVIQQEEIHTQTEVQVYERKNTMSRRVIDQTTLRIYVRQHLQTIYT